MTPLEFHRRAQLARTIPYLKEGALYYANLLSECPDYDVETPPEEFLSGIPILTKKDLADNPDRFRFSTGVPGYMQLTGGTSGRPSFIYGSLAEIEALHVSMEEPVKSGKLRPLTLTAGGESSQGFVPLVHGQFGCLSVPLRSRSGYDIAWQSLTKNFSYEGFEDRITVAALPLQAAKKLAHYILENGSDRSLLALKVLITSTSYLSTGWRALLDQVFQATIVDCFGFTEIPTARALECEHCGYYHFNEKVFPEVLAVDGPGSASEGDSGRLVVSSLYPYSQEMPLLRYESGDLVEKGPHCEIGQGWGIRPKGQLFRSWLTLEGNETLILVFPTDVQEIIDTEPLVARSANLRHSGVTVCEDDSFPKWRLRRETSVDGIPRCGVEIELVVSPSLWSDEWNRLRAKVYEGLLDCNPTLREAVESGRARLEVKGLPRGTLSEEEIFKV